MSSRELEQHPATISGVHGKIHVLLHLRPTGWVHEAVFSGEIATEPVHIGEEFSHKPTLQQIERAKENFKPYIDQQKAIREGWV